MSHVGNDSLGMQGMRLLDGVALLSEDELELYLQTRTLVFSMHLCRNYSLSDQQIGQIVVVHVLRVSPSGPWTHI